MSLSWFRGLRFQIFALVMLASVPCFLLVAGLSIQRRQADAEHVQADAVRVAMLATAELDNLVRSTRNLLVGLAQVPDVRTASGSCASVLRAVHEQSPVYAVMGVALPDGAYACSSIPSAPINLADRRHFRTAVDQRTFGIGDFVIGRASRKASLNLALPIFDEANAVQSVVIAGLDLQALSDLASRASLPDGSTLEILDWNGTVLAAFPSAAGEIGASVREQPLFAAIEATGREGTAEVAGSDGQPRVYAFMPLAPAEEHSPTVAVGIPADVAYGPANLMLTQGIMAVSLIGGLAVLLAWVGCEIGILRRTEAMLKATRRLTAGDLAARTGLASTGGELGELAAAFDIMAEGLQRREREHRQFEQSLEESRAHLQRESERLLTLHRISARLSVDRPDLDSVLDEILRSTLDLIGTGDGATFHLWDADIQALRRQRAWGAPAGRPTAPTSVGQGLVGRVFERGEPIVVNDYPAWDGALAYAVEAHVHRAFAVPVRHAGHRIGVLMIGAHAEDARPFDADDVRLVELLADQAAATLETARLYVGIAAQLERMHTLTRLNQVIFSTLDREAVLTEIARAAAEIFAVPFAAFWVLNPESQCLYPRSFSDDAIGAALAERPLTLTEAGFEVHDAQSGRHVEIADASGDGRIAVPAWWARHGLTTYYGIPMVGDDRAILGVLALYGRGQFRFSASDRDLLDSFVALAAVAVRNASLYQAESAARQLAEQANESKSAFLSRMSHELRTPLNAILGFAQVLEMGGLGAQDADSVRHILRAGKHLLHLVDEVLDIERIEGRHLTLQLESVPVAEVVADVVDLVKAQAASRSTTVNVRVPTDACVLADRQRLQQVLANLLTNAVKYNHEGGSVTITAEPAGVSSLRIAVSDTGRGIPAELMERLFSPFDRLGAERTGVQGTGLGLPIARALTEAMGGHLDVQSVAGEGSTFTVVLEIGTGMETAGASDGPASASPAALAAATASTTVGAQTASGSGEACRILYVEDGVHPDQMIARSLAWRPQVTLLTAQTGAEGLELAQRHRPALILSDVRLSDMTSAEMLDSLRADDQTATIPLVVVSGDAGDTQVNRLLASGARAHLPTPLDVRAFLGLVDEILLAAS